MYYFSTIIVEPDLVDHIPVEDNPVHVAMKRIDLTKNTWCIMRPLDAVN